MSMSSSARGGGPELQYLMERALSTIKGLESRAGRALPQALGAVKSRPRFLPPILPRKTSLVRSFRFSPTAPLCTGRLLDRPRPGTGRQVDQPSLADVRCAG